MYMDLKFLQREWDGSGFASGWCKQGEIMNHHSFDSKLISLLSIRWNPLEEVYLIHLYTLSTEIMTDIKFQILFTVPHCF